MNDNRQHHYLRLYAMFTTVCIGFLTLSSYRTANVFETFEEITVKRINVVSEDGQERLVISNGERQHSGRIAGRDVPPRDRSAGMIFFNEDGDECGGLVYKGGDGRGAYLLLSYDQYRNDQVMQLRYTEDTLTNQRQYGLQFWEFQKENTYLERVTRYEAARAIEDPERRRAAYRKMREDSLFSSPRMFVGRNLDEEVGMFINDASGRERIRIYIDTADAPRIEFLDVEGNPIDPR